MNSLQYLAPDVLVVAFFDSIEVEEQVVSAYGSEVVAVDSDIISVPRFYFLTTVDMSESDRDFLIVVFLVTNSERTSRLVSHNQPRTSVIFESE